MSGFARRLKARHAAGICAGFGALAAEERPGRAKGRGAVVDTVRPGGRAHVRRRGGRVLDAGRAVITAPFPFEEIWMLCGRRIQDDIDLPPRDSLSSQPFLRAAARRSIAPELRRPCARR